MATLTISTTPLQAKVQFTTDNIHIVNGSDITVRPGTIIYYTVSCEGYRSIHDSIKVTKDTKLGIILVKDDVPNFTLTVNTTPLDAKVVFNYAYIKQVMGLSLHDIRVNINQFITKLGDKNVRGTYLFRYVLNSWTYNGENVILSNYGITYAGTPKDSDELLVTYEKNMTFTNNTFSVPQYTSINYSVSKNFYFPIPAEGMPAPIILLDNDITLNLALYKEPPPTYNINIKTIPEVASVYAYKSGVNFKIVGNPTITQSPGYLTNFTNTDYCTITLDNEIASETLNSFEIVFDIETSNTFPNRGRILSVSKSVDAELGPVVELNSAGEVKLIIGSVECVALSNALMRNRYRVKWTYSDSSISGYYSVDNGITWTLTDTVSTTPTISAFEYTLGTCETLGSTYSLGITQLYYNNSYIKINNKLAWHCVESKSFNVVNENYDGLVDIFYTVVCDEYIYKYVTSTVYGSVTEQVSLVRSSSSPITIFESSVHGNYEVAIPISDYYNVTLVGAGGGAAIINADSRHLTGVSIIFHNRVDDSSGGGSGSKLSGQIFIKSGTYNVTVGTGGQTTAIDDNNGSKDRTISGSNGGDTVAFDNVAGGGAGGTVTLRASIFMKTNVSGGSGGVSQALDLVGVNGNSGGVAYAGNKVYGGASLLEPYDLSINNGIGAGGSGDINSYTDGIDGYIKITTAV